MYMLISFTMKTITATYKYLSI